MANTLNFVQTGENSQLLASLAQSKAALDQVTAAADMTGQTIDGAISGFKKMAMGATMRMKTIEELAAKTGVSVDDVLKELPKHMQNVAESGKVIGDAMNNAQSATEKSVKNTTENIDELKRNIELFGSFIGEFKGEYKDKIGVVEDGLLGFSLPQYQKDVQAMVDSNGNLTDAGRTLGSVLKWLEEQLKNFSGQLPESEEAVNRLQAALEKVKQARDTIREGSVEQMQRNGISLQFGASQNDDMVDDAYIEKLRQREAEERAAAEKAWMEAEKARREAEEKALQNSTPNPGDIYPAVDQSKEYVPKVDTTEIVAQINTLQQKVAEGQEYFDQYQEVVHSATDTLKSYGEASLSSAPKVTELERSVKELNTANSDISNAEDFYRGQKESLQELTVTLGQYRSILTNRQAQAEKLGDTEAAEEYKKKIEEVEEALRQVKSQNEYVSSSISSITKVAGDGEKTLSRYEQVLEASMNASKATDLGQLKQHYDEERTSMQELSVEMDNLAKKREDLQGKLDAGKMSDEKAGVATEELSQIDMQLDGLASRYQVLSERAAQFNSAITEGLSAEAQDELNVKIEETRQKIEGTSKSYNALMATASSADNAVAENDTKISATQERIDALNELYRLTVQKSQEIVAQMREAINNGDSSLAGQLSDTAQKLIEERNKISEEVNKLTEAKEQLVSKNEEIQQQAQATSTPIGSTAEKFGKLKEAMAGVSGGFSNVVGGFKMMASGGAGAAKGLSMVATGIKGITASLATNPIGLAIIAVVLAVKQLVDAFKRNEQAMTVLNKAAAPFKAIWQSVQRLFDDMVKTIVKVYENITSATGGFNSFTTLLALVSHSIAKTRALFAILGTVIEDISKGIKWLSDSISGLVQDSAIGQWINGVVDDVKGFFSKIADMIEGVANSEIGQALGLDELYKNLKEITGAQEELTTTNQELADMEQAIREKRRESMVNEAKLQAEIQELQKQHAEAAGDVNKQLEIGKLISQKQRDLADEQLTLAQMEYALIKKKNSLVQSGSADLDAEAQAEAKVISLKAKRDYTVSSMERRGLNRSASAANAAENRRQREAEKEKQLQAEITKAVADAATERIRIENSRIQAQNVARKKELEMQIKQIEDEEEKWRAKHKGRANASFAMRIENLKLKYEIDTELAEKQFKDWKTSFERETNRIKVDMELSSLQQQINLEDDVTKRIELQNRLFERQVELRREDIDLERDQYVKQQYGDKTLKDYQSWASQGDNKELLSRYAQSSGKEREDIVKSSGLSEELLATYAEMEQIFEQYENRYQQTVLQMTQEKGINDFNAEAERLQAFYDEVERINQEHNERVLQLQREGGTKAEFDQAKELRDQQLAQAGQQLGANDKAGLMGRFTNFANDIAGLTYEEIKKQYTDFFDILQGDIKNVGNEVEVLKKYDTEEDIQQRANTIGQQLESGTKEDGTQLTPDEEIALLDEKILLEQTLADIKANQGNKAALLNQKELELTTLKKGQVKATQTYTNAIAKAETKEQRAKRLLTQGLDATKEGLGAVKDATNAVADAFGGALSKKAKKALDTISDIADFAMQSIDGIKFVSENANKLMATTAETAAESVSTVEKASVILSIISLAVQAIMAIIKIASKFTESAKMQEQIDEYKEQVEDLKKEQERLEKAYKREVGSDYYKGMAKAAEKYNEVVQKNNQAIAEATKLYEYQKAKYGEDSDKAKDAKAQLDELKDAGEDYADSQKEIYDELAESLLGTNVTSFAEGLADSLVSAWQEGTTDMTDIWDTMLDDMKRDMMKKALSIALTDMFESTFDRISKLAKDGELNQSEIDQAIAEIDAKSAQAEAIAEQWRRAMEERGLLDDANPEADAGGSGSMSQDTADELNARFTALQMEGAAVVLATTAMQESMSLMQANSDRSLLLIQDIDRFQQLAYEQAQEHIDLIRAISDNVLAISKDTARLKAIEQNTDRL